MITKIILIDEDGKPYLEIDNTRAKGTKIDAVMMSSILDAVLTATKTMIDSKADISKINFKTFTILADRADNGHLVVAVLDKDEPKHNKTLQDISKVVVMKSKNLSDLRMAIIEILEKNVGFDTLIKEWGEDLWF